MLAEFKVSPEVFEGRLYRRRAFFQPVADMLGQPAHCDHSMDYVERLVSDLERKNIESITCRHNQNRRNRQHVIGNADWDHRPLFSELARQAGPQLGEADAVIVFDPSAFAKQGRQSAGVARQWSGRQGKIDNCQLAVYTA